MRTFTYGLAVLLMAILVFVAGNSFAQGGAREANEPMWMSVHKMIGSRISDQNGNFTGEIKDFVIDPSYGFVVSDILSTYRRNYMIFTVPYMTFAVPFSDTFLNQGGQLVYNYHEREMYYGVAPSWDQGPYGGQTWPTETVRATKLFGATVEASKGEAIHIDDLKIDFGTGQVYAVFPFNVDGKMTTVSMPLSWMTQRGENTFILHFVE